MKRTDAVSSGIPALDLILNGGYVERRLHLIEGRPGTGKTTLGIQFLAAGAQAGERVLYVTLSETAEELKAIADSHGISIGGIDIFELSAVDEARGGDQTLLHPAEVDLTETTAALFRKIDDLAPRRIVIDSLSEMRLLAQSPLRYRRQILLLKEYLTKKSATVLMLDDMTSEAYDLQLHSLAHAVITLEHLSLGIGAERRRLRVAKMRGVAFRGGYHDFTIRTGGIEVFPRLSTEQQLKRPPRDVVTSMSPELDQMLGGGLRRGTSTLLIGPAGSGKSSVALSYVVSAARRGEPSMLFAFDEGVGSVLERAAGLGMDIEPYVNDGRVHLQHVNPAEISPGEFIDQVCDAVGKGARVVVIDSLNGFLKAMPEESHLVIILHELLEYLAQRNVLTILTVAMHGLVGPMQTPVDVSYLSDNVLMLRFFEHDGRILKAISVMKKRVGSHEETIREFRLSDSGLVVGKPLAGFQGIMSGIPTFRGAQPMLSDKSPSPSPPAGEGRG